MRFYLSLILLFVCSIDPLSAETDSPVGKDGTAFAKHLDFATDNSIKEIGDVRVETLETEMGGYRDSYPVRTVSGRGSALDFTVPAPSRGEDLLLEIQEVHNRRPHVFGYTVLVNGREVYFRTYEEYGAGPNHYFVRVPKEAIKGREPVRVSLRSEGAAPFSIGSIWAYHDFAKRVGEREAVYRPMALHGLKPVKDQPKPSFQCFAPLGSLSLVSYGSQDPDAGRAKLSQSIESDARVGDMSVWLVNGTAWGGKPNGPDGLGGYFSDPRYSLLNYDAKRGIYLPSWPGMWASTAWPTLRDANMNAFLERRFQRMMKDNAHTLDQLKAKGASPNLVIVREWSPVIGEISNAAIKDAKSDGVKLDPSDGLDATERLWMHRDGVRSWQDYAASTRGVIERDSVLVDHGKVVLPETQLLDNLYAHPDFLGDWPMDEPRWSGGQVGMVPGFWSSGEMGKGLEYRELAMYDYLRARGRLAMINMERTILKEDFSVLKRNYARGFEFMTLFNTDDGDEKFVKQVDKCDNEPALPAVHREPAILLLDYLNQKSAGSDEVIVSKENIAIEHEKAVRMSEHAAPRLAVVDCGKPGEITYRLENSGDPFTAALNLRLVGRISTVPGNKIEILAGDSPENLRAVKTLTAEDLPTPKRWTPHVTSETSIDLGNSMIGKKEFFLRVVIHSPSAQDGAFLMKLSVSTQWARKSGYVGANPLTFRDERIMQLWVQDRALAANMLGEYARAAHLADGLQTREAQTHAKAKSLFDQGWYRSAYRLLAGEMSQILPARYVVRGGGPLGCWPVEVALDDKQDSVVVRLLEVAPTKVAFSLRGKKPEMPVRLTFTELDPAKNWALEKTGVNAYTIAPSEAKDERVTVENGKVTTTLALEAEPAPAKQKLPQQLVARNLGANKSRITVDCQDLALMGDKDSLALPISKNVVVSLKADGQTDPAAKADGWPEKLDRVDLELDDNGQVVKIDAAYGLDRGRIKEFHKPVLIGGLSVGGITLENGRRYDFNYDKLNGTVFATVALNNSILNYELSHLEQALKPGTEVEVRYTPSMQEGVPPRLFSVTQPTRVLLQEDFTEATDDSWKKKAVSVDGVDVINHRPEPNYLFNVVIPLLRPTQWFQPGSVVYHVTSEEPLEDTALEFAARAFEDSSSVEVFVSPDGKTWIKAGRFDNTWQNNIPQSTNSKTWKFPPQFIDLTSLVRGRKDFYLKIALTVGDADDRFCFGRFRLLTKDTTPQAN